MWEGAPDLGDRELGAIVRLVYEKSGITLHDGKRALVAARLQKRLREGAFGSFREYLAHVKGDESGGELVRLLDAIATNHTSFFREPQHFEYLRQRLAPAWAAGNRDVAIWSAACSTGEEPFTIAMTLADSLDSAALARIRIVASDLSTKALARARAGVYPVDRVRAIPPDVLKRYVERGLGDQEGLARIAPDLRRRVEFRQINLVDDPRIEGEFDAIFCRNVMIYFDKAVQQRVVSLLERHLRQGGTLFISHSESLNGLAHGLRWVAPAVYRREAS
jgi:chemotaxis protein methyltransferase CheR